MQLRVAVLYGGRSGEHEISVRSAEAIMKAMDPAKYKVLPYFISKEGRWDPKPISPEPGIEQGFDVVFPVLHGTFGEDGTVQGLLELADVPYVGAGVLASSVSMDKDVMKKLFRDAGLPIVKHVTVLRNAWRNEPRKVRKRLPPALLLPGPQFPTSRGKSAFSFPRRRLPLLFAAMLIVLVALVYLSNAVLGLLPDVGGAPVTLQRMLGYAMAPVCWLMGVPWPQAVTAGSLMGIKTVLNELIAYVELSKLGPDALDPRSRLIMLYAMCGFANFGSLGIMIGGLGTMAPERRNEINALGLKSIVSGTLVTCLMGAIVGMLT